MRTYFLACLLLPMAVAYASRNSQLHDMYLIWQYAKIPYFATVVVLGVLIWRAKTYSRMLVATLLAPVLMSVLELIFMVMSEPREWISISWVFRLADEVVPPTCIVSVIFVALSWAFFAIARKLRWVEALPW